MKNKYTDFARQYIAEHPEYLRDPDQLAFRLKIIGIPDKYIKDIVVEATKHAPHPIVPLSTPQQAMGKSHTLLFLVFYFILFWP